MWPLSIVEVDYARQYGHAFIPGSDLHLVQPFHLQDAIGSFGYGILKRVPALRHTDGNTVLLQLCDILIAAVLTPPVGVVDKVICRTVVYGLQGHPEGFQRVSGLQGGADRPSHDLVRVRIRYERQVAYAFVSLNIRYVAHPYLIGAGWDDLKYEVRILVVVVVRVGCLVVPAALQTNHEPVLAQQLYEGVPSGHGTGLLEELLHYQVELGASQAGVVVPVFLHLLDHQRLYGIVRELPVVPLVIRLSAVTKQPAEKSQGSALELPA